MTEADGAEGHAEGESNEVSHPVVSHPVESAAWWPFLLLGLGLLGVAVAAWRPIPAGVWNDDGVYMLVGKALAGGSGFHYEGVVGAPPAAKFPPLYPLLLSVWWWLFGGIGAVTLVATLTNLFFLAVAGTLFARALHVGAGLPLRLSLLGGALAFTSTEVLRVAMVPLSESLFMVIVAVGFAVWPSARTDHGGRARLALALVLVAAVATRSAGVAFVAGFGVALVLERGLATAVRVVAPSLAFTALWGRWAGTLAKQVPEGMRDLLGPYAGWIGDQVSDPGLFLARLPGHAAGVLERVAWGVLPGLGGAVLWLAFVPLVALTLAGAVRLHRTFPPLVWSGVAYLALLFLWPYLDRRLMVPLLPLIVAAIIVGALWAAVASPKGPTRAAVLGAVAVWIIGFAAATAGRIANDWPIAPYRIRAEQLATAVEALGQTAPIDAVVGAPEFWAALHLHGGWTVSPSALFDPRNPDPSAPMWGTPDEQEALWRSSGIEYLLLEQGGQLHSATLDRLEARCPETVHILARMAPLAVVSLSWDAPCGAPAAAPEG